ncbi:MAG TPA: AAA-associated domain-containing protein [Verrucomicrobiae bacterium]|jgi:NitT/TauT family transport system ATP-binding protein|nr:AAA-associated domain-containing protein [Verrucomicrobiae bacterium]
MNRSILETLRGRLSEGQWESAVDSLQEIGPVEAADFIMGAPFEEQQILFRKLPPKFAASLIGHFPYYHAYVLLHSRPAEEIRAIVNQMPADDRNCFLDELPEEAWQFLVDELGEPKPDAAGPERPAIGEQQRARPRPSLEARPIIEARRVEKRFEQPDDGRQIQVIAPIDLCLEPDLVTALLGPSGSGKSTLLRILSGLAAPSAGEVFWHGQPMARSSPNVAIVFQSFALLPWLSVVENVEAPLLARAMPRDERHSRALRALASVGLTGFETAYPKELSGGMKQRVGFARALAVEPEILFMDEPFSALDVLTAENLRRELMELWLARKIPTRGIFLVTHNIEEAVLLADRIVILGRHPASIRADFRIALAQPRDRKSASFLLYVDYIYKVMTQPELQLSPPAADEGRARAAVQMLPHARPGGIAGLLELLIDRGGEEDMYHVAEHLKLEIDDLLPIIEGATLLEFTRAHAGDVKITPQGRAFAEARGPMQKSLFREAVLAHAMLLQQMRTALLSKSDHTMPLDFFHDLLDEHFSESDTAQQLETALNWGRYAEILTYDPRNGRLRLHQAQRTENPNPSAPPRS